MTQLSDPHPIIPITKALSGSVTLPGSKSIANRSILLAAMSQRSVTLHDMLFSRDTEIMLTALEQLGFDTQIDRDTRKVTVTGLGGEIPEDEASIDIGNSGTSARMITAFLCIKKGGTYHLDGDPPMRKRPIKGLLDALESCGAAQVTYEGEHGFFPFTLKTLGYPGGTIKADASASSQILSALMMAAPFAEKDTTIHILGNKMRTPYVAMTLDMMEQFGQAGACDFSTLTFNISAGYPYPEAPANYVVEPDASAASYLLALPLVTGGQITINGLSNSQLQGDIEFADVLEAVGADIKRDVSDWIVSRPSDNLHGVTQDFYQFSDTFLTLAAISPLLSGKTHISGIEHTRKQETDRIHAMATELKKLGQKVSETEGSITIEPDLEAARAIAQNGPIEIDTYEDHRVAMSFGILGCYDLLGQGKPWLAIRDPHCCSKTFPDFFHVIENLRNGLAV
ncbi:MAG: 3-phosphoshikimate 1-carboxyvinyltransferase [Opitutales bacterium]